MVEWCGRAQWDGRICRCRAWDSGCDGANADVEDVDGAMARVVAGWMMMGGRDGN